MSSDDKKTKTLTDAEITTDHVRDRRGFLGLMAASGAAGVTSSVVPSA